MSDKVELTEAEVDVLGRLLQGQQVRSPLRAGVRLVRYRLCSWTEPDGDLALTVSGRALAEQVWPGVAPAKVASEVSRQVLRSFSPQLALDLPAHQVARPRPVDALLGVLGDVPQAEAFVSAILEHYPRGRGLSTASRKALESLGLTRTAAERITSAFSLSRACHAAQDRVDEPVTGPEDMAKALWVSEGIEDLEVEHFWSVALDAQRRIVSIDAVAKGGLRHVQITMREIFVSLMRARAAACFVAHNHPSGDLRYSDNDVRLTQRISDCALRLEIEFLDHLIIAPTGRFVSLEQEGVL